MVKPLRKPHFWGSTLGGVGWLAMIRLWFKWRFHSERIGEYMAYLRKSKGLSKTRLIWSNNTLPINLFLKVLNEKEMTKPRPKTEKKNENFPNHSEYKLKVASRMWVWFTWLEPVHPENSVDLKSQPHLPRIVYDQILSGEGDDPTRIRFP